MSKIDWDQELKNLNDGKVPDLEDAKNSVMGSVSIEFSLEVDCSEEDPKPRSVIRLEFGPGLFETFHNGCPNRAAIGLVWFAHEVMKGTARWPGRRQLV